MIEASLPKTWQELQSHVGAILTECGLRAEVDHSATTARGQINLDVWAVDPAATPPSLVVCECKHWQAAVPKNVVHGFRTVVADIGANTGFIISRSGFQSGAYEAAAYSNVMLVTWKEFQNVFEERWYQRYFVEAAKRETDPLIEYTEPINARIFRKADKLDRTAQAAFKSLREKYFGLVCVMLPVLFPVPGVTTYPTRPSLPIRNALESVVGVTAGVPNSILDAPDFRGFLRALAKQAREAIAEFDSVFGERA